jgi:glycosyltransferase involved in cell wall biosynthesis
LIPKCENQPSQSSTGSASEATEALPPGATVLQVLPALGHGGVERGTLEIAAAIVGTGGRALVASAGGPNVAQLEALGASHIALPLASKNPLTIWANAARLRAVIGREGVSLVHARSRAPAWSAYWAARRANVPFVTTYHAPYSENFPLKRRYNSVMAMGDRVIAISRFVADLVRARHGVPDRRLRVIHRGADIAAFRPEIVSDARPREMREAWGVTEGTSVVLLPGRLTRWKGHAVLIEAMAELVRRDGFGDVMCVLLGDASGRETYRAELERQVHAYRLDARVRFASHTNDMPAALKAATVVVSASTDPEGFGRTMVEASAMGKLVIASDHGGAAEIVDPGVTGWLVEPGAPKALADALAAALTLPPERQKEMETQAINRARSMFSREAMCGRTLDVYRELLA